MNVQHTNALIHATSPYLLQHAHNPVDWHPWDDQLIREGNKSGKLLLVSIGYAACHWCHVMEHESFEDEQVAKVMNENFYCIKVDREERPDIDNYYMTAIHLMGLQGGWPLNVIALPDGRPIWGGTYFPQRTWMNNISSIAQFWRENKEKTLEYAENLQSGIEGATIAAGTETSSSVQGALIDKSINTWKKSFDFENGGRTGYPKFPMPVNLNFLLYYGAMKNDSEVLDFVKLTLQKMAFGGIYDQIGGGFARYSTDEKWKVPHFEKMLYDNGQLISLYAHGFQKYKQEEFKTVVYEITAFISRELMSPEGAFFSSLDADSEGEEGKYYVWNQQELKELLKEDYPLFSTYFNVNQYGLWEQGRYILLRGMTDEDFAARHELDPLVLSELIDKWKHLLMKERNSRMRPGLDDKTLLSWNALVILGLADAYKVFKDPYFKHLAMTNARFIKENMMTEHGSVYHSWKKGQKGVNGFLEDYALLMKAGLILFEISGEEEWLQLSSHLLEFSLANFYDPDSGLFYFSPKDPKPAVTNHFQIEDNVIPAANSVMAHNLNSMYLLFGKTEYKEMAERMVGHIIPHFQKYPHAFANWGNLMMKLTTPYFEVAICGEAAEEKLLDMHKEFHPNVLWAIAPAPSSVPLLKNRNKAGDTLIYVCRNGTCRLPVIEAEKALEQIKEG